MEPDNKTINGSVTVLGAGSWGVALTLSLLRGGHTVRLWAHRRETADELNRAHRSSKLPGVDLPESLTVSSQLSECVTGAKALIIAWLRRANIRRIRDGAEPKFSASKPNNE